MISQIQSIKIRPYSNFSRNRFNFRTSVLPLHVPNIIDSPILERHSHIENSNKKIFKMFPAPMLSTISFNTFMENVNTSKINRVIITENNSTLTFIDKNGNEDQVVIPKEKSIDLYDKLIKKDVEIEYKVDQNRIFWSNLGLFIQYGSLVIFTIVIIRMFFSSRQNNTNNPFNFAKSKATLVEKDTGITFNDVAGLTGAKQELQEVVDFLINPEKYTVVGAKIPKGCLLVGPPGTGKTLLAKAVAGEAHVPFYSCSASEFVEMFVGVGASRVRDMFKTAVENAPCIIFIDEIDAIGKTRGGANSFNGGNDEREQTINQLLTEMDGFKENVGVIILAATNRVDVLDPALLRPGRFDRQIQIEYPDVKGRLDILKVHTKNKPLDDDVSLESLSRITIGYSGADLANLTNEAAILTARRNKTKIGMIEFTDAIEKLLLGLERESVFSDEKKRVISVHESGHTLIALKIGVFDTVRKVTIVPRGNAGGVTLFEPDENNLQSGLYSREYLLNQITVALGGRVGEEIVFGELNVTTGASGDIEKVQDIARMMVTMYGFSDKVGPIAWKTGNRFDNQYSEMVLSEIDNEIKKIVDMCYIRAHKIISENRDELDLIAEKLLEVETLDSSELYELLAIYKNKT